MAKAKPAKAQVPVMSAKKKGWGYDLKKNWPLYVIFLIPFIFFVVFKYIPMVGILMAFEDYKVARGLFGSEWVGWENFIELFSGEQFPTALRNTVAMALLNLTLGFVAGPILGLLIGQLRSKRFSRVVQTVTYMPYFVSAVVCCSLAQEFLDDNGAITQFLTLFGFERQNWLAVNGPSFWLINCLLGVWQRVWNITIPQIMPIVVMMFTMQIGLVFMTGFDKVLLIYMPSTYEFSDCLSTYTYRMAFGSSNDFGLSTASGLFQSVVGTILMVGGNKLSAMTTKHSMF